jgi:hypothetical protein
MSYEYGTADDRTRPLATLFPINHILLNLASNPGLHAGKPELRQILSLLCDTSRKDKYSETEPPAIVPDSNHTTNLTLLELVSSSSKQPSTQQIRNK